MSNLTELRFRVQTLAVLLDKPYPGLASWRTAYEAASRSILDFYGINVERIKAETWTLAVEQTIGDMERRKSRRSLFDAQPNIVGAPTKLDL